MKKICFVALAALALSACNSEPKFKVEGEVSGADGKMLYLEAAALEGIVPLDSVKLKVTVLSVSNKHVRYLRSSTAFVWTTRLSISLWILRKLSD